MNRTIIIVATLLVIVVAAFGALLFVRSLNPTTPGQGDVPPASFPPDNTSTSLPQAKTKEAVQATFQQAIAKQDQDNTKLYETAVAGDYALQVWVGDVMGGQALLKYDSVKGRWVVVKSSGGAWDVNALVAAGVPRETAVSLLAGVPQ